MKGDARVIELLNETLRNELTATNQYWLHYRMLDNWGMKRLAAHEREESIDEMKHADQLAERILMLDGLPNFQAIGQLRIDRLDIAPAVTGIGVEPVRIQAEDYSTDNGGGLKKESSTDATGQSLGNVGGTWPGGEIVRPQMVAFQDIHSGRILSWRVDQTPNKVGVQLALGDMIERLTIEFNRTRQAVITNELIEIISGAEAL